MGLLSLDPLAAQIVTSPKFDCQIPARGKGESMRYKLGLTFILSIVCSALAAPSLADAQCAALPFQLTNGQAADASQVMANFNALLGCINGTVNPGTAGQVGYYAANGQTISGTSLSNLLDSAIGSTRGALLERGASGWAVVPPGTSGTVLTSNGPGADPAYLAAANGSRGLFSGLLSAIRPSQSSTGFSTWLNQGTARVTDTTDGMTLFNASEGGTIQVRGLYKTAPTAPYTATMLMLSDNASADADFYFGWYDGTAKLDLSAVETSGAAGYQTRHRTYSSVTGGGGIANFNRANFAWIQIGDDGTNIHIRESSNGIDWIDDYTSTKASGFLGTNGYGNLFVGMLNFSYGHNWHIVSYQETSP
jgi:hypothetical protein